MPPHKEVGQNDTGEVVEFVRYVVQKDLNTTLENWTETHKIYVETNMISDQEGLLLTVSMIIIRNLIDQALHYKNALDACFVAFTKAFALVIHNNLWYKLFQNGVSDNMLNLIMNI